jgi:O-Antigen ligase
VLRATRVLSFAALAAAVLTCLTFGVGDVSDPVLLLWLRSVQWLAIALGLFWALRARSAPPWRVVVPLAGWLSVLVLSAMGAPARRDEAVATLTRPISGALLAWAVYQVACSRRRWLLLSGSVAGGGLVVTVVGLADVAGVQPVQGWLSTLHDGPVPVGDVPRLASLLSHPNVAASVLEQTLPLLVAATIGAAGVWAMLRDFPLLGVGPDNYRLRFNEYTGAQESHIGTHAHSMYLESLADSGVLGLAALCGFLIGLLRYASRGVTADRYWLWRGALLASLAAWLVHGLVDDFERFLPTHLAFWIVAGLAMRGRVLPQRA